MPDGTIYAGISPDTGAKMFTTRFDAPRTLTFNEAADHAKHLMPQIFSATTTGVCRRRDLNVLWQNRDKGALKGTFNVTGTAPTGWYWSSTEYNDLNAWGQRFSDGKQNWSGKTNDSSPRCV